MNDDTTEMKHPEELMELLSVFTGDSSYEKVIPEILERKKKGEVITMCTVAQGLMEKGRTEGRREGRIEGQSEQFRKDIINSINMLKKIGMDDDRIKELISESYGVAKDEVEAFLV